MRRYSLMGRRRSAMGGPALVPVGIATGQRLPAYGMDTTSRGIILDSIVGLGAKWVREVIAWGDIETSAGSYNWAVWDSIVSQCNARNIRIIAVLGGTPTWARPVTYAAGDGSSPPDSAGTFGSFAGVAAARYQASIHHWEIWNEQNIKNFWGGVSAPFNPSPTVYYGMLAACYDAIKAADPTATVISGGLAPSATGSGYISPPDFLDAMLVAGGGAKCDGYGHHPYSYPLLPSSSFYEHAWRQMYDGTPPTLSSIMVARSAVKKLWITEIGSPTLDSGPSATVANNYGVSIYPPLPTWNDEPTQANICTEALTLARARPDRFGCFMWYTHLDYEPPATLTDREKHFGLLEDSGTPKDAAAAFTAAINATGGPA